MTHIEKTVFISYRRTNSFMARAVYQSLTSKGFDVFFDYEGINSGDFEQIILNNLRARAHFIVILTPSALERCNKPGDWLRREIETAIDERRNIVPLFFEKFSFTDPSISQYLKGKLALLKNYNGLPVPVEYFDEAIEKLINRFLNVPLDAVLHPLSNHAKINAQAQRAAINSAPKISGNDLSAEEWFEKGSKALEIDEKIRCYTRAINLNSAFAMAYCNRGVNYERNGDTTKALHDYEEAIRLDPENPLAYYNRSFIWEDQKNFFGVIEDLNQYLRLGGGNEYGDTDEIRKKISSAKGALRKLFPGKRKIKWE